LRKAGLKSAEKRSGRTTAEGRVRAWVDPQGTIAGGVALTSETDFVARTPEFDRLARDLARHVADHNPDTPQALLEQRLDDGTPVLEAVKALSGKMGENMQVTRLARFENHRGRVGAYVHHIEKIGALVSITSDRPAAQVDAFARSLGMHVVASRPAARDRAGLPPALVERERQVYADSEEVLAKPPDKRQRIVEGKLEKFFASSVLLEQPWVLDPSTSVENALRAALGPEASIADFALLQVGG
jgi:elongation factor Ts